MKDSEGVDFRGQFLSERKKRGQEFNEEEERKNFLGKFQRILLFKNLP